MRNSPANASKRQPAGKTPVKPTAKDTSKSRLSSQPGSVASRVKPAVKAVVSKASPSKVVAAKKTTASKQPSKPSAKSDVKSVKSRQDAEKKPVASKNVPAPAKVAKTAASAKLKGAAVAGGKAKAAPQRSTPAKPIAAKASGSTAKATRTAASKPLPKSGKSAVATPKAAAATLPSPAKTASGKSPKPAPRSVQKAAPKAAPKVSAKAVVAEKHPVAAPSKPAKSPTPRLPVKPLPPVKADPVVYRPPVQQPKAPKMADVLKSLDAAMKFFQKANFVAAEDAFEKIIAKYPTQSDIVALVSRYIAICKSKLQTPQKVSQTPDSLYDQGVIEMNNGHFEAAIDLFRRALKSQPDMPYVLYSLAAAQVRLGNTDEGLKTLEQAVAVREIHRSKARTDPDFLPLRGDTRFQELVGLGAV